MSGERMDDRELVERARQGDGAALGEVFTRYWRAARAAAFGVTGDFSLAEDAAAEAFQEVLAGIASLREPDRFGPWLRTVVVRRARRLGRRKGGDMRVDGGVALADVGDGRDGPEAALLRLELAALLRQAAVELPERLREAVTLVYFEGFEPDAAARFLGIPDGTLRRRLHDGRERMRRTITEGMAKRRAPMSEKRAQQVRALLDLIDRGEMQQAFPPMEARDAAALAAIVGQALRVETEPARASTDAVAAAIRRALPEFEEWRFDVAETARRFFLAGTSDERSRAAAPPGFTEGRPGAFLRVTRVLVRIDGGDAVAGSMYEQVQGNGNLREAIGGMRLCDVIDLTWMGGGAVDLRAVQVLLERAAAAVLPGTAMRFSPYEEPRYRAALQMEADGAGGRAACGGVLAMEYTEGAAVAHARIYLDAWAAALATTVRAPTNPSAEQ